MTCTGWRWTGWRAGRSVNGWRGRSTGRVAGARRQQSRRLVRESKHENHYIDYRIVGCGQTDTERLEEENKRLKAKLEAENRKLKDDLIRIDFVGEYRLI